LRPVQLDADRSRVAHDLSKQAADLPGVCVQEKAAALLEGLQDLHLADPASGGKPIDKVAGWQLNIAR
jgi:hypothetical protein